MEPGKAQTRLAGQVTTTAPGAFFEGIEQVFDISPNRRQSIRSDHKRLSLWPDCYQPGDGIPCALDITGTAQGDRMTKVKPARRLPHRWQRFQAGQFGNLCP